MCMKSLEGKSLRKTLWWKCRNEIAIQTAFNHDYISELGKKSADSSVFSSKANMFIKHFNIHQKIPLRIIQEFFFRMRVECTRLSYLQPKSPAAKSRGDRRKRGQDKRDDWPNKTPECFPPHVAVSRHNPAWNPSNDPPWWSSTWRAQLSLGLVLCLCMRRGFWNTAPALLRQKEKKGKKKCFLAKHRWQFDGMKSSQGYDTVCNGCSSSAWLMRNRCYESLSNTVKLRLLSDSRGVGG